MAGMTYYPGSNQWEGNDSELHIFDSIPTSSSVRPALITQPSLTGFSSTESNGGTVKVVGDMMFDTERMCWVSTLDDEVDVFEGMADDEDDDPGATITRSSGRKLVNVGGGSGWNTRLASESSAGASQASWEESRGCVVVVDDSLRKACKEAEERHKLEMWGWCIRSDEVEGPVKSRSREEKRLREIRTLAYEKRGRGGR